MAPRAFTIPIAILVLSLAVLKLAAPRPEPLPVPVAPTVSQLRSDSSPSPRPQQDPTAPVATHQSPQRIHTPDPASRGTWTGRLSVPLIELARAHPSATPQSLHLPLSTRESATVLIDRFEAFSDTDGIFEGSVEGKPGSTVVLSYVGLAQAGIVHLPAEGRVFRIRGTDDGAVHITEVDLAHAPECGNCLAAALPSALAAPSPDQLAP